MKARPSEIVNADHLFVGNQPSVGGHLKVYGLSCEWKTFTT
jgi:hypothetical protein